MSYEFDVSTNDFVNEDQFFMESVGSAALETLRPPINPAFSMMQDPIAIFPPAFDYVLDEGSVLFEGARLSMDQNVLSVDIDHALSTFTTPVVDIPAEAFISFLKSAPILF